MHGRQWLRHHRHSSMASSPRIAVAAVTAMTTVGTKLSGTFGKLKSA
jgi:hypothetical protein